MTAPPATLLWRRKLGEWLKRYGPAEVIGTMTAVVGSFAVARLSRNEVAAAYGGAMGENVGFYGTILLREFLHDRRSARTAGDGYGHRGVARTLGKLVVEFGPAEMLDSFILRPLAMGVATHFLGRGLGVIVGKIVGDVTFYLPVIASYELRRWFARRRA
jgi:hypothetical protein